MEKVGMVKDTPEDMVVLYRDHAGFLLRRFEVKKDDMCMFHNIRLDDKEAETLVSLLQQSIKELRDRVKQEQETKEAIEGQRDSERIPDRIFP